jgi:hypothetical protein
MTREDAKRILDAARDGEDVPVRTITRALAVSGDLRWRQRPGRSPVTLAAPRTVQ